jgi:hypothetical protein
MMGGSVILVVWLAYLEFEKGVCPPSPFIGEGRSRHIAPYFNPENIQLSRLLPPVGYVARARGV